MMYQQIRALWASEDEGALAELALNPLAHEHPVARALLPTRAPLSFSYSHLPLYELCQLALIWAIGRHGEAADELASRIYYLVQKFPLFGCKENHYPEKEAAISVDLFLTACGLKREFEPPRDPFFIALASKLPRLTIRPLAPVFGFGLYERGDLSLLLALSGKGSPLGAIRAGEIEVRAFGPTTPPLSDPTHFGIVRNFEEESLEGWTSVFGMPENWLQVKSQVEDKRCDLQFRFMGLEADKPLFLAFYIKAENVQISGQTYKPKSLNRYQGDASLFSFTSKDSTLYLKSSASGRAQLIPLAGEGGFWNADFLLAFELQPIEPKSSFTFLQK